MKTLIQVLFSNKKKVVKREGRSRGMAWGGVQIEKMAKLGQTLVVMSR